MSSLLSSLLPFAGAALGANQKTGGTQSQSTSTTTPTEPGYFSGFRQSLIQPYQNLLTTAQRPVYGQPEQAGFLNSLNANTAANMNQVTSNFAGRGGSLNSGAYYGGLQNLMNQRGMAQANYATQTPLLNKQAMMNNTSNVLGMGLNWAGKAPTGSTTNFNGTVNNTSGSFLNSLASLLGQQSGAKNGANGTTPFGSLANALGGLFGGNNDPSAGAISGLPVGPAGSTGGYGGQTTPSIDSTFSPNMPGMYDPFSGGYVNNPFGDQSYSPTAGNYDESGIPISSFNDIAGYGGGYDGWYTGGGGGQYEGLGEFGGDYKG